MYMDIWGYVDENTGVEYALLCTAVGIIIIDVSDPTDPVEVSRIGTPPLPPPRHGYDVKAFDHYIATNMGDIIDVSNVEIPEIIGTFQRSHNIFIEPPYLYGACPNYIYDISNPSDPVYVTDYGDDCHDITVINDTAYVASGRSGTRIIDMVDKSNLVTLGSFSLPSEYSHHAWPTSDGNYLLLTDETGPWGLTVWDISDYDDITIVAQYKLHEFPTIHNVFVKGEFAYISHYTDGMSVLDITDPTKPEEVGYFDTYPGSDEDSFSGCWGVYPFAPSGNIYVSDRDSGLYVVSFDSASAGGIDDHPRPDALPKEVVLEQNYPNPFNPITTITYSLPTEAAVRLTVLNLLGQEVATLVEEVQKADAYELTWEAGDAASGIYFYQLRAGEVTLTRKMVLIR